MRFAPNISLIALPDQYWLKILSCLLRNSYFEIQIRTPTLFLSLSDKLCFHAASRLGELQVELLKLYIRRLL